MTDSCREAVQRFIVENLAVTQVSSQPDLWHKDRTDCDVIVSEDLPGIGRGSGRGNSNAIAGGGAG